MRSVLTLCLLLTSIPCLKAQSSLNDPAEYGARIVQRERQVAWNLMKFHPIVETYVQVIGSHHNEPALSYDRHFVSVAEFSGGLHAVQFKSRNMEIWRDLGNFSDSLKPTTVEFDPSGFVAMAYPDPGAFDLMHYRFEYVKAESLGAVRCLVFQVTPIAMRKSGLFEGKIWVEEQKFTIVRFSGIYLGTNLVNKYFHFDSWRVESQPGQWIPAVISSEETGLPCCGVGKINWSKVHFRAQTRFWGYDLQKAGSDQELTRIVVDSSPEIQDAAEASTGRSAVAQEQAWERQAEDNLTERLERLGIISPAGSVEHKLQTILANVETANHLAFAGEVRCRVLLTSNLESAVVGRTILVSRGLIDVVPNDDVLAAVLAHNLALVNLEGSEFTNFAWADENRFDARDIFKRLRFVPSPKQQESAAAQAREWLANSAYAGDSGEVARFTANLRELAPHIERLLKANIGESLAETLDLKHADKIAQKSSKTETASLALLPLGSRLDVDPWSGRLTFRDHSAGDQESDNEFPFELPAITVQLRNASNDTATAQVAFSSSSKN
jgi:hypothetical protein